MGSHPAKTLERDPVHGPYDKALMKRGELARRLILEGLVPPASCRGQASNPILALRGEGKNEDAKSRPGRASSLRRLSIASCTSTALPSGSRRRSESDRGGGRQALAAPLPGLAFPTA